MIKYELKEVGALGLGMAIIFILLSFPIMLWIKLVALVVIYGCLLAWLSKKTK